MIFWSRNCCPSRRSDLEHLDDFDHRVELVGGLVGRGIQENFNAAKVDAVRLAQMPEVEVADVGVF